MSRLAFLTAVLVAALALAASAAGSTPRAHDPLASLGVPDFITYETHGAYTYKCEVWTAAGTVKATGAHVMVGYVERCYLAGKAKGATVKPKAKGKTGSPAA